MLAHKAWPPAGTCFHPWHLGHLVLPFIATTPLEGSGKCQVCWAYKCSCRYCFLSRTLHTAGAPYWVGGDLSSVITSLLLQFYHVPTMSASFSTLLLHLIFFPSLIKAPISELHIFSLSSALSFLPASLLPVILHPYSALLCSECTLFTLIVTPPRGVWKGSVLILLCFLYTVLSREVSPLFSSQANIRIGAQA